MAYTDSAFFEQQTGRQWTRQPDGNWMSAAFPRSYALSLQDFFGNNALITVSHPQANDQVRLELMGGKWAVNKFRDAVNTGLAHPTKGDDQPVPLIGGTIRSHTEAAGLKLETAVRTAAL